jgi:hypothetical protein
MLLAWQRRCVVRRQVRWTQWAAGGLRRSFVRVGPQWSSSRAKCTRSLVRSAVENLLKMTALLSFARPQAVSNRIEPFEFGLWHRSLARATQYPSALTPRVLHVLILTMLDNKTMPLDGSDPVSRGILNEGSQ